MMKKSLLCMMTVLATALLSAANAVAQEYTLREIYQKALNTSEKMEIARENVYVAQMSKDKALSLLIPRLTAYGTYNRFTEDKYNTANIMIQPEDSAAWGVRADQTFSLSARELDALRIAGQSISKSEYDLDWAKSDFLLAVASSFYDVLKAQKALDITVANLERLTKYYHLVETRMKVGELTKTALLRAQGELSGAKSDYLKASNALKLARAALTRLTGVEPDFRLKEETVSLSEACDIQGLRKSASDLRTDLKSYDMQTKMAGQQVKYARGAFWPSVGLFAIYNRADQDPAGSTFNDENIYGGISLTFPFFEGGLGMAEFREARAKERQARLAYDDLKKSVDIEVEAACLDLDTLKGSLKFLEDQQIFARDNYNAVMKQFENGLATSLDVMDANTLLLTADKNVVDALYNYQLASLTVKKSSGTLLQFVRDGDPAVKGSSGALWQLTDVGDLRAKKSGGRLLLFFSIDES
ncbi:MAG: TolC family protein [Deltaproteobacteria bacterium]|nr:TolC family protein [Deltaproteobacteria bacterium]